MKAVKLQATPTTKVIQACKGWGLLNELVVELWPGRLLRTKCQVVMPQATPRTKQSPSKPGMAGELLNELVVELRPGRLLRTKCNCQATPTSKQSSSKPAKAEGLLNECRRTVAWQIETK